MLFYMRNKSSKVASFSKLVFFKGAPLQERKDVHKELRT